MDASDTTADDSPTADERAAARARMYGRIAKLAESDAPRSPGAEYFDATPTLRRVREWAASLDVNPFAALGVVLARLSGDIPPWVVLPSLGGSAVGSLNLYVVLAGGSGMGKSDVLASHDQLFRPRPHNGDPVVTFEPATGEGVITRFVREERRDGVSGLVRTASQAFADIDEVDVLEAQNARAGSTVLPVLKSMWSAKGVGGATATRERDKHLDPHSYRLSLIAGCQYGAGEVLFNQRAQLGGFTQRFVFADLADPDLSEDSPTVSAPPPLTLTLPDGMPFPTALGGIGAGTVFGGRFVIGVAATVHDEMRKNRRRQRMQRPGSIDGHWLFAKLRVAALLAILHGERTVTDSWWRAAHGFMTHSDATRQRLIAALHAERDREAEGRGRGDAIRSDAADMELIRRVAARCVEIARRHAEPDMHDRGGCTTACMTRGTTAGQRDRIESALEYAVDHGWFLTEPVETRNGPVSHYWATPDTG